MTRKTVTIEEETYNLLKELMGKETWDEGLTRMALLWKEERTMFEEELKRQSENLSTLMQGQKYDFDEIEKAIESHGLIRCPCCETMPPMDPKEWIYLGYSFDIACSVCGNCFVPIRPDYLKEKWRRYFEEPPPS